MSERKYEINPDNLELANFAKETQARGIMPSLAAAEQQANLEHDAGIAAQLNQTLTGHAEAARKSNILRREDPN